MAKINWVFQNESGTNLNRYIATNVNTGEQVTFDLLRGGNISIIGTPLNADNMNSLINAINSAYDEITNLTNSLKNGTISVKNAENVKKSIAGVDLQEIFMMDDTYSFDGDSPTVVRAMADSDGNPINSTYLKTSGGVMSSGIQIKNNSIAPTGISYSASENIPMLINTSLSASNQRLKFMGNQGGVLTLTMPSKNGTLALTSDIPNVSNKYLHNIILKGSSFTICIQTLTNSNTAFSSVEEIQNYLNNYFDRGYIICTGYFGANTILYAVSSQMLLTLYGPDGKTYTINYSDITTFSDTIPL